MKLLLTAWLRESLRSPQLTLFSIIGVALGVATVAAVNIANQSARESFTAASKVVSDSATHVISGNVTDQLYAQLRLNFSVPMMPVVRGGIIPAGSDDQYLELYGFDVLAQLGGSFSFVSGDDQNVRDLVSVPHSVVTSRQTLEKLGAEVGDTIEFSSPNGSFELKFVGIVDARNPIQEQTLDSKLLADIATAQSALGLKGQLSSIRLELKSDDEIQAVTALLPKNVRIESQSSLQQSRLSMTEAFQTNLSALAMLALLVAIFLVYNTMTFLVMRRRRVIGIVRALGAKRFEFLGSVAIEILCIGAVASVIGLGFGIFLSEFLLALVERSIDNLYFPIKASVRVVSWSTVALAMSLGLVATLLAAVPALREASLTVPSISTREHYRNPGQPRQQLKNVIAFALCQVLSAVILLSNDRSAIVGFIGIGVFFAGCLFIVPVFITLMGSVFRSVGRRFAGVRGILACRAFTRMPGRTSSAVFALCLAISVTVGVGLMISSFRAAVDNWLETRLRGDFYVTSSSRLQATLNNADIALLGSTAGVEHVGVARWTTRETNLGDVEIFAVDYGRSAFEGFWIKETIADNLWEEFVAGGVIISEPLSWKHRVTAGDTITFINEGEAVELPIIGVYYDYISDQGIVSIYRDVYLDMFQDSEISSAMVMAQPQADLVQLGEEIERIHNAPGVTVWRNRELKDASMDVFDQTFLITSVLRGQAIVVAFIAVASILMTMQIERRWELGVQRAMGFNPKEIWKSICVETGLMGLVSGLLSLPMGAILAWLLIWVINQRSHGWTIALKLEPGVIFEALLLGVVAALFAGILPAWKLARRSSAQIMRNID